MFGVTLSGDGVSHTCIVFPAEVPAVTRPWAEEEVDVTGWTGQLLSAPQTLSLSPDLTRAMHTAGRRHAPSTHAANSDPQHGVGGFSLSTQFT